MPTFKKKPEVIDARQFTGEEQNRNDLILWIQSHGANAHWSPAYRDEENDYDSPEYIYIEYSKWKFDYIHVNDWVILKQDGRIVGMGPEDFNREYEQV